MIDTRFPYTYSCDFIRHIVYREVNPYETLITEIAKVTKADKTSLMLECECIRNELQDTADEPFSRSKASTIRDHIADIMGMDYEELAALLSVRFLANEEIR